MARVTVEDCLARVPNRFALTILASRRARALSEGRGNALVDCENKEGVTALREISAARVRFREDVESTMTEFIEEQRRQLRVTAGEHTFLEAASLRALEEDDEGDTDDDADVEELQSDPEALNKQAKGDHDTDEDDDEDDAEEEEEEDVADDADESSEAIEIDDTDDLPADDDDDDDSDDEEEEEG